MILGPSGVGKTVIIESMLKKLSTTGFSLKTNSILGSVFNFAERSKPTMITNVSSMFTDDAQDLMGLKKNKSDELSNMAD